MNINVYNCETCNYTTKNNACYKNHLKTQIHLNGGIKPFKPNKIYFDKECKICGQKFTRPYSIKRHMIYKHPEENADLPYKCEICQKAFYINSLLQQHLKSKNHIKNELNK